MDKEPMHWADQIALAVKERVEKEPVLNEIVKKKGYIVYDDQGRVAVQISWRNRENFKSDSILDATGEEQLKILTEYLAYFGEYEVDESRQVVKHKVLGDIFPNNVGKT